jgi:hypothetical protein
VTIRIFARVLVAALSLAAAPAFAQQPQPPKLPQPLLNIEELIKEQAQYLNQIDAALANDESLKRWVIDSQRKQNQMNEQIFVMLRAYFYETTMMMERLPRPAAPKGK